MATRCQIAVAALLCLSIALQSNVAQGKPTSPKSQSTEKDNSICNGLAAENFGGVGLLEVIGDCKGKKCTVRCGAGTLPVTHGACDCVMPDTHNENLLI